MNETSKVFKQTFWQVLGKAATSLSTLAVLAIITRRFGESGTGVFTLALAYLAFFYLAADFGLNAHLLPKMSTSDFQIVWRKLLGLRLLWSLFLVFLAIILLPILPFSKDFFPEAVLIGALAIVGSAVFVTANAIFQSRLRYDLSIIASASGAILSLLAIYILSAADLPVYWLLAGHLLGWLLTGLLAWLLIRRFISNLLPLLDLTFIKKIFFEAWPISATLILNVVYFRADAFILSSVHSFAEVGIYNLAYQIFQSALVLPTFIMNSFYPIMLENLSINMSKFLISFSRALGLLFFVSLLGVVLTWILAPFIINLLAGNGFEGSVLPLRILSLSFPAYFLSALLMWTLVSLKKYKIMTSIYLAGLVVNIILNLIFIPQYSYIASSWITGVSEYLILSLQALILAPVLIGRKL